MTFQHFIGVINVQISYFCAAWTSAGFWCFRWWILDDLPLAISRKLAGSSAWYLCSSRGESLMKLVRSGEYLASRLSGRGKDLGKNQNGTAESRVMNPAIRYPSHQAPTQRASPGVMLMLSVRRQSHTHTHTHTHTRQQRAYRRYEARCSLSHVQNIWARQTAEADADCDPQTVLDVSRSQLIMYAQTAQRPKRL